MLVQYEARSNEAALERIKILKSLVSGEECIVIAPAASAVRKLPPDHVFRENMMELMPVTTYRRMK